MKKFIIIFLCCIMFSGCYDMDDIENINSISLIYVDEEYFHFCSVIPTTEENKNDYEMYSVKTNNLYYGINKLSQITGKKISLSHLKAMIFSDNCKHNLVKKSINSLLQDTNTHPKVMTAFIDADKNSFLDAIKINEQINISVILDKILTNRYTQTTKCTARQLSCALNFDVPGFCVPLIKISNDNVIMRESIFVNNIGMQYINETVTSFINLTNNTRGGEFVLFNDKMHYVILVDSKKYITESKAKILLKFSGLKNKNMIDYFKNEIIKIYKDGFDVFGFGEILNRKFIDEKSKTKFLNEFNGINSWVKQLNVDLEVVE